MWLSNAETNYNTYLIISKLVYTKEINWYKICDKNILLCTVADFGKYVFVLQ